MASLAVAEHVTDDSKRGAIHQEASFWSVVLMHSQSTGSEVQMGWRFRKSFSPVPGVRLTVSPRLISSIV